MTYDRVHAEDRQMNRAGPVHRRTRCSHFLQHDRRFRDTTTAAAVRFGNRHTDPTRSAPLRCRSPTEIRCVAVEPRPVLVRKIGADLAHRIANQRVFFGLGEVHVLPPRGHYSRACWLAIVNAHSLKSAVLFSRSTAMAGKYFEELESATPFTHQPSRTVTETDNLLFTALTLNPQPLHLDAEFARTTQHGQILVNSIFTLGPDRRLVGRRHHAGYDAWQSGFRQDDVSRTPSSSATRSPRTPRLSRNESRRRSRTGASSRSSIKVSTSAARSSARAYAEQ